MKETKITWYKIADHINEIQFSENNIGVIEAKGKKICIAKFDDNAFAFSYKCPHAVIYWQMDILMRWKI